MSLGAGSGGHGVSSPSSSARDADERSTTERPDYAITVEHVSKDYRLWGRKSQFATLKSALLKRDLKPAPDATVPALRDLSFAIDRGEAFGVIGRNGSGKSTLLKILSGILKPTIGRVSVNGRVAALIELGAGFHPEITGRENVYINGIMLGLSRREIDARFDRIVEFSGIGNFIDQPVKTYSSGMYVRLGFAVAVHVDPDVLLVDEVLSVGDEEFSQKCIAKIQEMKYRGVTLVFVTHQLDQVRNLCDRALWLDHGEALASGDPVRVVDAYLQQVAAGASTSVSVSAGASTAATSSPTEPTAAEEEAFSGDAMEEERWGSGEVILKRVVLTDSEGRDLIALGTGSAVTIEMDVGVRAPQDDFVFGVGIYHGDGTCVYGTNTDLEGLMAQTLENDGRVRFVMPSLDLVAGSYRIDAAIHTRNGRAFDYRRGCIRFTVGSRVHEVGVYRPKHRGRSIRSTATFRRPSPSTFGTRSSSLQATVGRNAEPAATPRKDYLVCRLLFEGSVAGDIRHDNANDRTKNDLQINRRAPPPLPIQPSRTGAARLPRRLEPRLQRELRPHDRPRGRVGRRPGPVRKRHRQRAMARQRPAAGPALR
jgi:lipopolysaccharide transport system ATP-binding protein